MNKIKLTYLKGKKAGDSTVYTPPGVFIGREKDNDLQILEDDISKYHAKIMYEGGRWILYDLNSSNGTKLNGTPVKKNIPIQNKDIIRFADIPLRFEITGSDRNNEKKADYTAKSNNKETSDSDAIRIRAPEEARAKKNVPLQDDSEKIENDPRSASDKSQKKNKPNSDKAEARKMRRLRNEAVAEKKKRIQKAVFIAAVLINLIILAVWIKIRFF